MGVRFGRGRGELLTLSLDNCTSEAVSNERAVFMFDGGKGGGTTVEVMILVLTVLRWHPNWGPNLVNSSKKNSTSSWGVAAPASSM